jgi:uncharacterized membrane protein
MKFRAGYLLGALVIISGISIVSGIFVSESKEYSGKIVFQSEQEYSQFKEVIAKDYVSFDTQDILVLSSSPPIVVQFKVEVQGDNGFPYGKKVHDEHNNIADIILGVIGAFFIAVGIFVMFTENKWTNGLEIW